MATNVQCPIPHVCGVQFHRSPVAIEECRRKQEAVKRGIRSEKDQSPSFAPTLSHWDAYEDEFDEKPEVPRYAPVPHNPRFTPNEVLKERLAAPFVEGARDVATHMNAEVNAAWSEIEDLSAPLPSQDTRILAQREIHLALVEKDPVSVFDIDMGDTMDPQDVRGTLELMQEVLRNDDSINHYRAYTAAVHFKEHQDRINQIAERQAEYDRYLRSLDTGGTDGKFTYDLGEDAKVDFTPSRNFDPDLARSVLTEEEIKRVEKVVVTIDQKMTRALLEDDDPDRWEACRTQGTTRVRYELD